MRIVIEQKGENCNKSRKIVIPTFIFTNRIFAYFGAKFLNDNMESEKYGFEHVPNGSNVSSKEIYKFLKEVKNVKKRYPKFKLVEVISSDDDNVTVYL